jgi:hypothetical protein
MACFAAWYVLNGGNEGAPEEYRAYANHVERCATCTAAELPGELCRTGGALFDALDDDPTDPGRP